MLFKHYHYKSLEEFSFKIFRESEGTPDNIYKEKMLKLLLQINIFYRKSSFVLKNNFYHNIIYKSNLTTV